MTIIVKKGQLEKSINKLQKEIWTKDVLIQ